MARECSVHDCNKEVRAHGLCPKHLYRWEKYGDPNKVSFHQDGQKKNNINLYRNWQSIKTRCYNKNCKKYKHYGGRGITVDDRWLGPNGFDNFLADMGQKPGKGYSIDRIDVNGPYSPDNCRWATWEQQENNKRTNRYYEFNGEKRTLPQWSRKLGISYSTLLYRKGKGLMPPELFSTS